MGTERCSRAPQRSVVSTKASGNFTLTAMGTSFSRAYHGPQKSIKGSLRCQLDLLAIELLVGSHQSIAERLRLGDEQSVKRITMVERERAKATGIVCSERQRFDARGQGPPPLGQR